MASKNTAHTYKTIPVASISLDLENPRYVEEGLSQGIKKWTDKSLQDHIMSDNTEQTVDDILPSIIEDGVTDPVWVQETGSGKYVLVEGNRRIVILRNLVAGMKKKGKDRQPPPRAGVSYDKVKANIYPKSTEAAFIETQKVRLQTGKKKWGAFNEAAERYRLKHKYRKTDKYISEAFSESVGKTQLELKNYQLFRQFKDWAKKQKYGGQATAGKYSYFQKASNAVRQRFFESTQKEREKFFKLLIPDSRTGITRIPNVSLKGGLIKTFNKFAVNEKILNKFLKTPRMTTDEGLIELQGKDVNMKFPWLKKMEAVAKGIIQLNKNDVKEIKKDKKAFNHVKKLFTATKNLIKK